MTPERWIEEQLARAPRDEETRQHLEEVLKNMEDESPP